MAEKEIEDYIKTQKSLGVRDDDIKRSLVNAGYSDEDFAGVLERHAAGKKGFWSKEFTMTTRHLMHLNIALIVVFGLLFAYITYDYNAKFQDISITQQQGFNRTDQQLKAQSDSLSALQSQTAAQGRDLESKITDARSSISSTKTELESKIGSYNYNALTRDAALQESFQKATNKSLTELSSFSKELEKFRAASVDFSPIIPKAVDAVVTIGKKGAGFFQTAGSGVLINSKGYIVTNWHVIDDVKPISVKTSDDKDYSATLVGKAEEWDIAVIKLDTQQQNFTYLEFKDSDKVAVGDHVIAVGNPVGFDSTVTEGIISNTKRLISGDVDIYYLQTDVAINAGNSGGPLIDKEGRIVGIATLKYARSGFEGLSFALRANDVQGRVLEILQEESK